MSDYLKILGECFPEAQAYVKGANKSPYNYADLTWMTTPIDQATLDASPCATGNPIDIGTDYTVYSAGVGTGFYHGVIPFKSGTTRFSDENSPPVVTEGTEIWSFTVTPNFNTSVFTLSFTVQVDTSKQADVVVAVFRNSTLVGATSRYCSGSNKPGNMHVQFTDFPSTTSDVTYSARIGLLEKSGTWYINRTKDYTLGDSMEQNFVILENQ